MDAIQPPNRYMGSGPPPPPMADPQLQQQQQLQSHPHASHSQWYNHPPPPPQFQYHHQPPPQWHHQPSYPSHPIPPYPASHPHPYAPPRLPLHTAPPPPPPHHHQPYPPQPGQQWGDPNWVRHQGWEYPERNILHHNEEDWAARARAWAAAKAAMENQHASSQFTPVGRTEDHSHVYSDHYQQTVDPHFTDIRKTSLPLSSPPQLPVSVTNPHRSSAQVLPESTTFSSGTSYVSDGPVSYSGRDGAPDMHSISPSERSVFTSSSSYQQEVPSSYSTMPAGHGEFGSQNEKLHMPLPQALSSHQEAQPHSWPPPLDATGTSMPMEQAQFMHQDQFAESIPDGNNQPLDFERGPRQPTNYVHPDQSGHIEGTENIAVASSVHSWTPGVTPGAVFPPVPPGTQFDPAFPPPSVPGHPAAMFGRIAGPGFRPGTPSVGAAFGLGTGSVLHPPAAFPGDANGVFNVSERPKKASVPNWLREEIIKKKAVIASSSIQEHPAEDSFRSVGAEGDDKYLRKGDQVDNKSTDSTRSNEDEEDDEDDVEAARSAAINQEIKRILTEVLLKVTDELFDEIATKVLSEDELMVEVDNSTDLGNHKASPPPAVPTPKASGEILIPVKVRNTETGDATEKSNSSSPGDVLGLANYASDDDEVESTLPTQYINGAARRSSGDPGIILEGLPKAEEKGTLEASIDVLNASERDVQSDSYRNGVNRSVQNKVDNMPRKVSPPANNELSHDDGGCPATSEASVILRSQIPVESGKIVGFSHGSLDALELKDNVKRKDHMEPKSEFGNVINEKLILGGPQVRETRNRSDKDDGHENTTSSVGKDFVQGADAVEAKANQKHLDSGSNRKGEGRDVRKEKGADERNSGSRERGKDRSVIRGEKGRESESKRSASHADKKDDKKETEKVKSVSAKEESNRKRDKRRDEMEDRSRHRDARDTHRYKRRRSSSVGSRGKDSKENSLDSHTSGSNDETSENSKHRKLRSNKRSLSRSPTRSRRRQVSRSPHSKHSQRRHSPYSSLEARGRRSRSGTPVRRRR